MLHAYQEDYPDIDPIQLEALLELRYSVEETVEALRDSGGDTEAAAQYLLSGEQPPVGSELHIERRGMGRSSGSASLGAGRGRARAPQPSLRRRVAPMYRGSGDPQVSDFTFQATAAQGAWDAILNRTSPSGPSPFGAPDATSAGDPASFASALGGGGGKLARGGSANAGLPLTGVAGAGTASTSPRSGSGGGVRQPSVDAMALESLDAPQFASSERFFRSDQRSSAARVQPLDVVGLLGSATDGSACGFDALGGGSVTHGTHVCPFCSSLLAESGTASASLPAAMSRAIWTKWTAGAAKSRKDLDDFVDAACAAAAPARYERTFLMEDIASCHVLICNLSEVLVTLHSRELAALLLVQAPPHMTLDLSGLTPGPASLPSAVTHEDEAATRFAMFLRLCVSRAWAPRWSRAKLALRFAGSRDEPAETAAGGPLSRHPASMALNHLPLRALLTHVASAAMVASRTFARVLISAAKRLLELIASGSAGSDGGPAGGVSATDLFASGCAADELDEAQEHFGGLNGEPAGQRAAALSMSVVIWVSHAGLQAAQSLDASPRGVDSQRSFILRSLFDMWVASLGSPSMMTKFRAFSALEFLLRNVVCVPGPDGSVDRDLVAGCLAVTPVRLIRDLAARRLDRENEDAPQFSRYLQRLVGLVAAFDLSEAALEAKRVEGVVLSGGSGVMSMAGTQAPGPSGAPPPSACCLAFDGGAGCVLLNGGNASAGSARDETADIEMPWTAEFWVSRSAAPASGGGRGAASAATASSVLVSAASSSSRAAILLSSAPASVPLVSVPAPVASPGVEHMNRAPFRRPSFWVVAYDPAVRFSLACALPFCSGFPCAFPYSLH